MSVSVSTQTESWGSVGAGKDYVESREEVARYFSTQGRSKAMQCQTCLSTRAFLTGQCFHIHSCPGCFGKSVQVHGRKPTCFVCGAAVIDFYAPNGTKLPWWCFTR